MKAALLLAAFLMSAGAAFTQGTLQVGNAFTGAMRSPIYGVDPADPTRMTVGQSALGVPPGSTVYGGPLLQGTGYTFALFAGPAGVADPGAMQLVITTTFRTANGDILPAGLVNTAVMAIPGVAPGQIASLQVRVWDNRGGTVNSWAQVLTREDVARGTSSHFQSQQLGGTVPNQPPLIPPQMTGWTSFNIYNVPEPSVLALGALGLATLCLRRRKN